MVELAVLLVGGSVAVVPVESRDRADEIVDDWVKWSEDVTRDDRAVLDVAEVGGRISVLRSEVVGMEISEDDEDD